MQKKRSRRLFSSLVFLGALGVVGGSIFCSAARGVDFKKETIPGKWIEQLVPEDLPGLEYPNYFNALDRARMQMQTGRYRLSLITLANAKDVDVVEAAIVKGSSL